MLHWKNVHRPKLCPNAVKRCSILRQHSELLGQVQNQCLHNILFTIRWLQCFGFRRHDNLQSSVYDNRAALCKTPKIMFFIPAFSVSHHSLLFIQHISSAASKGQLIRSRSDGCWKQQHLKHFIERWFVLVISDSSVSFFPGGVKWGWSLARPDPLLYLKTMGTQTQSIMGRAAWH